MLERDYQFYKDNKAELAREHSGKFIVIKNKKVIGTFPSKEEAIEETSKAHELGTFLVQFVSENDEQVQHFHSRVAFHDPKDDSSSRLYL